MFTNRASRFLKNSFIICSYIIVKWEDHSSGIAQVLVTPEHSKSHILLSFVMWAFLYHCGHLCYYLYLQLCFKYFLWSVMRGTDRSFTDVSMNVSEDYVSSCYLQSSILSFEMRFPPPPLSFCCNTFCRVTSSINHWIRCHPIELPFK